MKVLFLAGDPALGPDVPYGDSIRVRLLIEALEEAGAVVDVRWSGPARAPDGPVLDIPRSRPIVEAGRQIARDARDLVRSVDFYRRARPRGRPDVVFEFASYLAPAGQQLARRLGVPYVVEVEGPLGDLRYERSSWGMRPLGDALERRRLRAADAVVAVSQPLADHLLRAGANAHRIHVVPNVVDLEHFKPDPERRKSIRDRLGIDGRFVVGFHGVLSPWYGVELLAEAVALASVEQLSVLIVGDGVERARVEAAAARAGTTTQVAVTGFVPHDDIPGFVDAFDVAAIPAHAWWTSPLKLFEYGAMHKPVIAARALSVTAVASGDEVALVDERSPQALAAAIDRLAHDPGERERLAARWSARVTADYGRSGLSRRLAAILEQVTR